MKFSIETHHLASALSVVSVAAEGHATLPILGNVKIEAKESQAIFATTNLELWATATRPATVKQEGAITLPIDLLRKLVSRLQSTQADFTLDGKEMKLRCGDVDAVFETLPADEFPPEPTQNEGGAVECDASDIVDPFAKVSHAIGCDPSRYTLMGVNLNDGHFIATDGRRISVFKGANLTADNVIVPDLFVRAVLKIKPAGKVKVNVADAHISLRSEDCALVSKLIEGQYPNWRNVVPKNGSNLFACGRKDLIDALRTCAIFTDASTKALNMIGRGKQVEISEGKSAKAMVMGTELAGQPKLTMRFNCGYMLDVLGVLDKETVTIRCSDSGSGMVVEEGPFKAVIMPMRAN